VDTFVTLAATLSAGSIRITPMPVRRGSFRVRLAAIVAGAVVLRLLYVLVLARHVPMAGDSQFFNAEANLVAEGKGYIEPFVNAAYGTSAPTAAHPPLYPTVLAGLSFAGLDGVLAHRALGAFLGGATIVLVALIGRRVGGERVGLAAAAIAALYPLLVAADGAPMSESLYGLLIAGCLLLALRLRERRSIRLAAALGAVIGLAALTRSEALLLLVLLALPLTGRAWKPGLALLAACVVVLTPWTIRNFSAFDRFTLISHNDSTVLAGANCSRTYHGADLGSWRFDCISQRRTLQEGKQAATWRRKGIDYAISHAGRWAAVVPVRVLRTWDLWQPHREVALAEGRARWAETAGVVAYFLLLPLAIGGAVLLWRRDRGAAAILLVPALLVTISSAIGYGNPRFRHAFEMSIVVLAGSALVALARRRQPAAAAR
jgi:4-amino-4-deoxy-L-arabinose transferase-like glycosyltransferase